MGAEIHDGQGRDEFIQGLEQCMNTRPDDSRADLSRAVARYLAQYVPRREESEQAQRQFLALGMEDYLKALEELKREIARQRLSVRFRRMVEAEIQRVENDFSGSGRSAA